MAIIPLAQVGCEMVNSQGGHSIAPSLALTNLVGNKGKWNNNLFCFVFFFINLNLWFYLIYLSLRNDQKVMCQNNMIA